MSIKINKLEIENVKRVKAVTLLLKDGIVYFEYDREFKGVSLEISPIKLPLSLSGIYTGAGFIDGGMD